VRRQGRAAGGKLIDGGDSPLCCRSPTAQALATSPGREIAVRAMSFCPPDLNWHRRSPLLRRRDAIGGPVP
jgi:hypothetical protein